MPYTWTESDPEQNIRRLELWPYRSLSRRGFAIFIGITFVMVLVPLTPVLGTAVLWGLLPFMLLAVGGIWLGLERSYHSARLHEALTITDERVHLVRTNPKGDREEWDCNSYWAQVNIHPKGGPVEHYVTLSGKGREVEIGAFLSEGERKALYGELSDVLSGAGRPKL
jgi:uncharacterized membrane protein